MRIVTLLGVLTIMPHQAAVLDIPENLCLMMRGASMKADGCHVPNTMSINKMPAPQKAGGVPPVKNQSMLETYLPAAKKAQATLSNKLFGGTELRILAAYISESANKLNGLLEKLHAKLGRGQAELNNKEMAAKHNGYSFAGKNLDQQKFTLEQDFSTDTGSHSAMGCVKPRPDRFSARIAANKNIRQAFDALMEEPDPMLTIVSVLTPSRNNKNTEPADDSLEGLDRPWVAGEEVPMAAVVGLLTGVVKNDYSGPVGRFEKDVLQASEIRKNAAQIISAVLSSRLITEGFTDNEILTKTMLEGVDGVDGYKNKTGTRRTANSLLSRQLFVRVEKDRSREWILKSKMLAEASKW